MSARLIADMILRETAGRRKEGAVSHITPLAQMVN
tara:strand:- start:532 stop:636 length:105 start_codon:yes stop_codon:yes gene_type:complete